jgi:hypothetical protein
MTSPELTIPLGQEALIGLAGDIVEVVDPHTEAAKVATLVHFLVAIGNAIGPSPYAMVGHDQHPARLFAMLVGKTSKARKGSARGAPLAAVTFADETWAKECRAGGLSSGEGLIFAVRDPVEKMKKGEVEIIDDGAKDKRLLVEESEFASVLTRMRRDGNSLSAVLRQAYDSGTLRVLTKNSPLRATGSHISVVAHITAEELATELTASDQVNGFANRFLFFQVTRAKWLADPEPVPFDRLAALSSDVQSVLSFAKTVGRIRRDPEAATHWADIYPRLSAERPGLFGSVTARSEAHVLRLSVLYALLDRQPLIGLRHLEAALGVWKYADESARQIFGEKTGDPVADRIEHALRARGPLSRNQIRDLFLRHVEASRIDLALDRLLLAGRVSRRTETTPGRPVEIWEAA